MLTKEQIAKLLNRPLSEEETANYSLYLNIATERLEDMLCLNFTKEIAERVFYTRDGYRTVFTDPFVGDPTVTVDGVEKTLGTDYTVRQFDRPNTGWSNSVVFKRHLHRNIEEIAITAEWGFDEVPVDIQLFLSKLFDVNSKEQNLEKIPTSKKIEDFSVTYQKPLSLEEVIVQNSSVIAKYAQCSRGSIRSGHIYPIR